MRPRIRAFLLLLLLGGLLLEGLTLARVPLFGAVHGSYPHVGIDREGRVVYYDTRIERDPHGGMSVIRVHVLDTTRNDAEILALGPLRAMTGLLGTGTRLSSNFDLDYARFLRNYSWSRERGHVRLDPLDHMARNVLHPLEMRRRGIADARERRIVTGDMPALPIDWRVEGNRLVCRETATGRVVAGLGPDGYVRTEKSDEGARFGRISVGPLVALPKQADVYEWLLVDANLRTLYAVSMRSDQNVERSLPVDSAEPVQLAIDTRPLHPPGAAARAECWPYCMIENRRMLAFLGDGSVVGEIEIEPGETVMAVSGATLVKAEEGLPHDYEMSPQRPRRGEVCVETWLPGHPDTERRRLRLLRPGQAEIVRDVVLTPTHAGETFFANLTAALALLRPAPLSLASALSPVASDRREHWWWRDPWLAAGSYPGWLALSLALAAFLAWRARRAARERCATVREVRFWTAAVFLLGPVGVLWMRFVLPQVPVEAVGGTRRAVNLDASPSASAPWPEPKPLGIEVIS